MPTRDQIRIARGAGEPIVERGAELESLRSGLDGARDGTGRVLILEGPAGIGKSRLLAAAAALANELGVRVVRATGAQLERNFPLGVAIQLFETTWADADADQRAALTRGPAHLAGALFEGTLHGPSAPVADQEYPLIHGLFSFARNLTGSASAASERTPLAILVEDAQWADQWSLRFLAYIGARIADLPILLMVATRPREESADRAALTALQRGFSTTVLRPRALTRRGVWQVVCAEYPDADRPFLVACHAATGGNPFLLAELLSQIREDCHRPDAATASRLAKVLPNAVLDATRVHLEGMSRQERALASAIAVLGSQGSLKVAARLAGLETDAATQAADSLAEIHLLASGLPLSFIHPVIRSAVLMSMSPLARGQAHRRAAVILREEGVTAEMIAPHLMAAPAEDDPAAVDALRIAAQDELRGGHPEVAAGLLSRALDEQPSDRLYPEVLAELGQAEAQAGSPQASERLGKAIRLTENPRRRAELALVRGRLLVSQTTYRDAAFVFEEGLRELGACDSDLATELEAAYISAAALVPDLADAALSRRRDMLDKLREAPDGHQRSALACTLILDSLRGEPRTKIRRLADLAWAGGSLLPADPTAADLRLASLTGALLFVDEVERAIEIGEAILSNGREHQATFVPEAAVAYLTAWPRYERGQIDEAAGDAEAALDAPDHCHQSGLTAYGTLAACHIQRGQLEHAEMALAIIGDEELRHSLSRPFLIEVRARLRLAQRRYEDATADAVQAGEILESEFGVTTPGAVAWRSTAALAQFALGHADRAEELAADELEIAQAIGVTRVEVRDLRVLAMITGGKTGIELLEQAVETAERYPLRLESTLALLDFGAALRRAKKRAAAREPLRKALELSHQGGATMVAARARMELAAAGARPRRDMLTGADSLTQGEQRVADQAVQDMTTRMIAETLFITPKTVEFHLRNIYQKLDVSSRAELVKALGKGARAA